MPEVPSISDREAIAAFEKAGFSIARVKGSHHIMKREGHANVLTIPTHGHENVAKGTLKALIRDAGMTVEQFCQLLSCFLPTAPWPSL